MNSAGIVESCLVKRGCSYLAQNNAQEVTRGVSFEVALLSGSVPFEAIEKQSENEIRNVTLPLGESGSKTLPLPSDFCAKECSDISYVIELTAW